MTRSAQRSSRSPSTHGKKSEAPQRTARTSSTSSSRPNLENRSGKLAAFLLITILSVGLVFFVWFMQRQWRQPVQRSLLVVHTSEDPIRRPLTLLIATADSSRLLIVPLPRDQQIPVMGTGTEYPSDAWVGVTELEKQPWSYLISNMGQTYGIQADGVVWTDQPYDNFEFAQAKTLANKMLFNQVKTTVRQWDRWSWQKMVYSVPAYKAERREDLNTFLNAEKRMEINLSDRFLAQFFQDTTIRQNRVSVAVLNASGQQGRAQQIARMLELIGFEVRSVDTIEPQEQSKLLVHPDWIKKTDAQWPQERLHQIFSSYEITPDTDQTERRRTDVVVIVGRE